MPAMSTYTQAAFINAALRGTTFTAPATAGLGLELFTADPTVANLIANRVTAPWYTRQLTGTWTAPASGVTSNNSVISFPAVTGSQITITHVGIYDAASGGNLLFFAPLAQAKTLDIGDVLSFAVGALTITLT